MALVLELLQPVWSLTVLIVAVGLTVIVNVFAAPVHVTPLLV